MSSVLLKLKPLSKGFSGLVNSQKFVNKTVSMMELKNYNTLAVTEPSPAVFHVQLNRPKKLNAINDDMWKEIGQCFNELDNNSNCRVVVLSGSGKIFCSGIDLMDAMNLFQDFADLPDVARKCKALEKIIKQYQNSFTSIEQCSKPVIAAVHGACIGGAVDMICAADIRYCTADSWFQVKEVDLGMAADVGTLQRLPKIIGSQSLVRELAYTARKMQASEALKTGLVSDVLDDQNSLLEKSLEIAKQIASKSPVAVQGTKLSLNYSRDHTVEEGLNHIAMRNQVMLQSEDFVNAASAMAMKGEPPIFSKL